MTGSVSTRYDSRRSAGQHPLLRLEHVSKTFAGQRVLDDVSIEIRVGEVHTLVGENGSGKSTLIKILSGYHQPDHGARAWVRGEATSVPEIAQAIPVRAVHQELGVIGALNAVDNMAIGSGYDSGRLGTVHWRAQRQRTEELLARVLAEPIDILRPMAQAPRLHWTAVAIARALQSPGGLTGLLILDEPTSSLPRAEIERLFTIVRDLEHAGVGILYVSHSLREIFELAKWVTVLKDGHVAGTCARSELDERRLLGMMLGEATLRVLDDLHTEELEERPPVLEATEKARGSGVLEAMDLSGGELRSLSFKASKGEILGFAGLLGSGHLEVAYLLGARAGLVAALSGSASGRCLPQRSIPVSHASSASP